MCEALPDSPAAIGHLDGDTAVSRGTAEAAFAAAGAVCRAVDEVVCGAVSSTGCCLRGAGSCTLSSGYECSSCAMAVLLSGANKFHADCLLNHLLIVLAVMRSCVNRSIPWLLFTVTLLIVFTDTCQLLQQQGPSAQTMPSADTAARRLAGHSKPCQALTQQLAGLQCISDHGTFYPTAACRLTMHSKP